MPLHVQVTAAYRAVTRSARHKIRDLRRKEGGLLAGLYLEKPPSLAEHRVYVQRKAWVPPGHDGGVADRYGALWGNTLGTAGVAVGNTISALAHRPFRSTIALLAAYALTVIALFAAGEPAAAIWMIAGLAVLGSALVAALRFWPQKTKKEERSS